MTNWTLPITALWLLGTIAQAAAPPASHRPVMQRYCVGCHNEKLSSGNVNLQQFLAKPADQNPELAEKVIRRVRAGLMPPAGAPRPDSATTKAVLRSLESTLDRAAVSNPNPGTPPLHRLNRTEYARSVRDLLGLDIDAATLLPPDDLNQGFDNIADSLTISPTLVEAYVRAAGKISRQAIGDPAPAAQRATYTLPRVISQTRHVEGAPFGTRGGISVIHHFPADAEYAFRLTFYFHQMGTTLFGRTLGKGQQIEVSVNGERKALLDVDPMMKQFEELRTPPIWIKAGPQRISAAFLQKADGPVEDTVSPVEQSLVDVNVANIPGLTSLPHLHDLIVDGPHRPTGLSETPTRRAIFVCRPIREQEEMPCARRIVSTIARRAFRRPLTPNDYDRLLGHYQQGRQRAGFEGGIQTALQAILSHPEFVFRFERQPERVAPGGSYRISDLELASRLSYFLWSTAPDDRLLTLASQNQLHQPASLEREVRRMLADPRAEALSTNFAGQWLTLQNLKEALPDPLIYPNFDRNLANSMRRETELFFGSIVKEDRDVRDLLNADYTFVDERLARHYRIPNISGSQFRRVTVTDENRRGLLGHASILTLTSTANRTAPVLRGKWVLEVLLGTPPPPPPPNVPALKEIAFDSKLQSVRDRLKEHRANPACASCHKIMDPIGFALENFDAVGAWRNTDLGFPVDAGGQLYDGAKLHGPASLRRAVLAHSDAYLSNFTEKLMTYGLGRVLKPSDMPAARAISRQAALQQNRFSAFVLGIVNSAPFQLRRADLAEPAGSVLSAQSRHKANQTSPAITPGN